MSIAYIAMGSNLGEKKKNLLEALSNMENRGLKVLAVSSFVETEPYGVTDQPFFINAVVKIATEFSAHDLLRALLDIEQKMGRVRKRHWGERNIDLDLLFYDNLVIKEHDLVLPHPDMQNRLFVLAPLAEIAGEVVHPVFNVTVSDMLNKLTSGDEDK
ncbi:MAG: 2-amino-4-hydroxy-6-hydroxymethyldihydropteridine diphosphokinase [Negativicutes bacterium]|nr:2-amino-4-hydroxy-6-hydroxymethyldihydropteridine diphosphokinase [Negativicutes bacterium]